MNNQEILTKAIEKAIENGWESIDMPGLIESFKIKRPAYIDEWPWYLVRLFDDSGMEVEVNIEHILFDHDFARALWGTEMVYFDDGSQVGTRPRYEEVGSDSSPYYVPHGENYKYHLQQMVLANDPIKYLGERISNPSSKSP